VTIRNQRVWLIEIATALALSGRDLGSIRSLADLVGIEAVKTALMFFWNRNGRRKTGQLHNFARLLVNIAKHWVNVPPAQLGQLQALRRQVDPGRGGLTDRNRTRLRVFDDPANVERLVNLPETMTRPLVRLPSRVYNDAVRFQSAVAIAIQLVAPLRAKNLAGLMLDRHFVRSRPGPNGVVHLVIAAGEVKNKNPLEFELPPDVVRLLDFYNERFRPLLLKEPSPFLFPARQGGAKAPAQLAAQVKRAIKTSTGLIVNLHLFRHIGAFLYLKAYPGDYETVRLLLGHKDQATTVRAYCGLERNDAIRRYDKLIGSYRRNEERPHAD
jgi:integrase